MDKNELGRLVFANFVKLKRLLMAQMHAGANMCDPLPHAQIEMLMTISQLQPVSFKRLADSSHLTPGAVTQIVEQLSQQQLVARKQSVTDRRISYLSLAEKGEEKIAYIKAHHSAHIEQLTSCLTTEELQQLLHIQEKLITACKTSKRKEQS